MENERQLHRGNDILITQYVTAGIAFIVVGLRLYARLFEGKNAGLDDLCIAIATGLAIFACVVAKIMVTAGIGQPVLYLSLPQITTALKWFFIAVTENWISLFFVRMSVGFFLLRLLPRTSKTNRLYRRLIVFMMIVNFIVSLGSLLANSLNCIPISGFWDLKARAKSKCLGPEVVKNIIRIFGSISAAVDFTFALLPLSVISGLQMNSQKKIVLGICIGLGILTGGCAIGKAVLITDVFADPTYNLYGEIISAILEVNIGMIAASLPGMLQFFLIASEYWRNRKSRSPSDPEKGRSTAAGSKWISKWSTDPSTKDSSQAITKISTKTSTISDTSHSRQDSSGEDRYEGNRQIDSSASDLPPGPLRCYVYD